MDEIHFARLGNHGIYGLTHHSRASEQSSGSPFHGVARSEGGFGKVSLCCTIGRPKYYATGSSENSA